MTWHDVAWHEMTWHGLAWEPHPPSERTTVSNMSILFHQRAARKPRLKKKRNKKVFRVSVISTTLERYTPQDRSPWTNGTWKNIINLPCHRHTACKIRGTSPLFQSPSPPDNWTTVCSPVRTPLCVLSGAPKSSMDPFSLKSKPPDLNFFKKVTPNLQNSSLQPSIS